MDSNTTLITGALDQLMRHSLTGCAKAAPGRADGVLEAILWHGGEAEASRDGVLKMDQDDRAALVKFVEYL
jgi:CxxC motif-containing protein (DUF1111 family)